MVGLSNQRLGTTLKKHVILAYTDIAAAGVRALLGVNNSDFVADNCIEVEELTTFRVACPANEGKKNHDIPNHPITILNHYNEELTLIIVNVKLNKDVANFAADAIMNRISESEVKKVTVLAAEHSGCLSGELKRIDLINSESGVKYDDKISDPFLNVMLQFLLVEPLPTSVLLVDGHAAKEGTRPNRIDGSAQSIELFHEALNREFGLQFNKDYSMSLEYRGHDTDDIDISENMYI